jgi:hypothetical protein
VNAPLAGKLRTILALSTKDWRVSATPYRDVAAAIRDDGFTSTRAGRFALITGPPTVWRTGESDPFLPFRIGPVKGREA